MEVTMNVFKDGDWVELSSPLKIKRMKPFGDKKLGTAGPPATIEICNISGEGVLSGIYTPENIATPVIGGITVYVDGEAFTFTVGYWGSGFSALNYSPVAVFEKSLRITANTLMSGAGQAWGLAYRGLLRF